MLVDHQVPPIWRQHTIYCTHSAYPVAYISGENYLILLKLGIFSPLSEEYNFILGKPLKNKS